MEHDHTKMMKRRLGLGMRLRFIVNPTDETQFQVLALDRFAIAPEPVAGARPTFARRLADFPFRNNNLPRLAGTETRRHEDRPGHSQHVFVNRENAAVPAPANPRYSPGKLKLISKKMTLSVVIGLIGAFHLE